MKTKDEQKIIWFTFFLQQKNGELLSTWIENNSTHTTIATDLLPFTESATQTQCLSTTLLGDISPWKHYITQERDNYNEQDVYLHIRIMTNDAALTMLPWQKMTLPSDARYVIEVGPQVYGDQSGYFPLVLSTPLLVIPTEHHFNMAGDRHYQIVQEYLHSYLDIHGTIPRVYSPAQLKRELDFQQPDLLYIYAKYEQGMLMLDRDPIGGDSISLDTLGQWLAEIKLRPVIILSLLGDKISTYPEALVSNSRLLWIQQTQRKRRQDDLINHFTDVLQGLQQTPEISRLILQSMTKRSALQHQLWVNGRSLCICLHDDKDEMRLSRQLRAALLRVMLGRRELKERMFSEITRSDMMSKQELVSYVVSGNEMACPFDFPTQLQQRLQWDDHENALPVIPFYFHIDIEADQAAEQYAFDTFDKALTEGLFHGSNDVSVIFEEELERRGLFEQPCCISLNWLIRVYGDNQQQLEAWLQILAEIFCDDFSHDNPNNAVVISAICLQIMDKETQPQTMQQTANRVLKKAKQCSLRLIRINDALGKLQTYEIEDFFDENPNWRQVLQLDTFKIDSDDYADWIVQQQQGNFDATVRLVWQQYQQGYQQYLKSKQTDKE